MQVLAKSHDLLSRREWQPATIEEIVCNAVEDGWGFEEDQIILDLTPTPIRSQEVVMFSMIIHELMTNALKHGALSHPTGNLFVRSSERMTEGQCWIDLEWIESSDGDFVPPSSHGFGLQLLERAPRFGLSGHGKLEVEPNGLTYRLSFPVLGSAKMFSKD